MKYSSILVLIILSLQSLHAQSTVNVEELKNRRFKSIGLQHCGAGFESDANKNMHAALKLFYNIGSHKNLINTYAGCKYTFSTPFFINSRDAVYGQHIGAFAEVHLNIIRRQEWCTYIGTEIVYDFAIKSSYINRATGILIKDNSIAKDYSRIKGKIGIRFKHWDVSIHYGYNMSPFIDQKYVFESKEFDYDSVYALLYERHFVGFSLSYLIKL